MAVTQANNRILMVADNDALASSSDIIRYVTIVEPTAAKFYRLKQTDTSGQILWEYPAVATPDNIYTEACNITCQGGIHLDTDDAGTDFKLFLNVE
jgi:hypothetical protein